MVCGCRALTAKEPSLIAPQETIITVGDRNVRLTLAVFSIGQCFIQVIDNAGPNDSAKFERLVNAMEANGCIAGCNGGFFNRHPFAPVGGMISNSRRISAVKSKTWMKGLLVVRNGHPSLESVDSFHDTPDITDLLQSGTWLVRAGQSETDNSRAQVAPRTFICHDGKGRWAIGISERCTLDELAALLRNDRITAIIDVREALNLDGGPSTGLWLKGEPDDFYMPEKWPVRNYVGISPQPRQ